MGKAFICLFCFSFCWAMAFAQQKENNSEGFRGCKESRISKGACYDIIEFLRVNQETDSIAVEIFKDEYKIDNMSYRQREWLFKKNYTEIINYFSWLKNKDYHCQLKAFINNDPVLLME